jgi:hypothetical protein
MWHRPIGRTRFITAWRRARVQFAAVVSERDALRRELEEIRRERDGFRAHLRELSAAVRARQDAEAALAELYRERAIARALRAQRDPEQLLQ